MRINGIVKRFTLIILLVCLLFTQEMSLLHASEEISATDYENVTGTAGDTTAAADSGTDESISEGEVLNNDESGSPAGEADLITTVPEETDMSVSPTDESVSVEEVPSSEGASDNAGENIDTAGDDSTVEGNGESTDIPGDDSTFQSTDEIADASGDDSFPQNADESVSGSGLLSDESNKSAMLTVTPTVTPTAKPTVRPTVTPTAVPAVGEIIKPGLYNLVTADTSGLMMAVKENSSEKGANIQLGSGAISNVRIFDIQEIRNGSGIYTIRNLYTGGYISVTKKGNVEQSDTVSNNAQKWSFQKARNGSYSIINRATKKAMTVAEYKNGANILTGTKGTEWTFKPAKKVLTGQMLKCKYPSSLKREGGSVEKPAITVTLFGETLREGRDYTYTFTDDGATGTILVRGRGNYRGYTKYSVKIYDYLLKEGLYAFTVSKSGQKYMLCVKSNSPDEKANIQLGSCASSNVRLFRVVHGKEGYYYIQNFFTNKYLTAVSSKENANIVQKSLTKSSLQLWEITRSGSRYLVRSKAASRYMTAKSASSGANVRLNKKGAGCQKWSIKATGAYITGQPASYSYNKTSTFDYQTGRFPVPVVSVSLCGKTLRQGTDYTVGNSLDLPAGTGTITLKGKSAYQGTKKLKYALSADKGILMKNIGANEFSGSGKTYRFHPVSNAGAYIRGSLNYAKSGVELVQKTESKALMSGFRITYTSSGYKIVTEHSDYVLHGGANGRYTVTMQKQAGGTNQRWLIKSFEDGSYAFINRASGYAMTMDGSSVILYPYCGIDTQRFIPEEIENRNSTCLTSYNNFSSDMRMEWLFTLGSKDTVLYLNREGYHLTLLNPSSGICVDMKNQKLSILKGYREFDPNTVKILKTVSLAKKGITPVVGHKYRLIYTKSNTFGISADLYDLSTGKCASVSTDYSGGRGWGTTVRHVYGSLQYSSLKCYTTKKGETLGIIGDSYTEGHTLGKAYKNRFATVTETLLGADIAISGKAGAKSANGLNWLNDYYLDTYSPKYVLIEFGMNDKDYNAWLSNMQQMISLLEQHGITPILATVPPVTAASYKSRNAVHHQMSEWIRSSGYRYIDLEFYMTVDNDRVTPNDSLFLSDKVHPSSEAHRAIAEMLCEVVREEE